MSEPAEARLVDANELRRLIEREFDRNLDVDLRWSRGIKYAITLLDAMPPLEVPRGWSRDELLAAMDAGSTVERLGGFGNWYTPPRSFIWAWPDDVVAYDVRVVAPVPETETEDVPLHEVVGRKLKNETMPVAGFQIWTRGPEWWGRGGEDWLPVSLNADGTVTVQAEGEA